MSSIKDYARLVELVGELRSCCFQRLQILSTAFRYVTMNDASVEMQEQSRLENLTYVQRLLITFMQRHEICKQFVDFVANKARARRIDTVVSSSGQTLNQYFYDAGLGGPLTIDAFND
jgi:hypothetical protein